MNNSERKLEIFVGATKRDLEAERLKVLQAILEDEHIPSGMELWSSDIEPTRNTILNRLNRCDIHIVLVGARYGELMEGQNMSFTEWEYWESAKRRPVLAFVLAGKDFDNARALAIQEDPAEADRSPALDHFRKTLLSKQFCRSFPFQSADELGRLVTTAIHKVIDSPQLPKNAGWMRADSEDLRTGREIRENPFLDRVLTRIRQFSKLTKRVVIATESKQALGKIFWKTMIGSIREMGYTNLFFESGSTLAYVSHQFEADVLESDKDVKRWSIRTNNVETLLQLVLHTNEDVRRLPIAAPDPDDPYGAIFPPDWKKIRQDQSRAPRNLYDNENKAIIDLKKAFSESLTNPLLLATTSGLDLEHSKEHFRGPHVGSHPNMLFKRAIFTTGSPVVLFLHAEKLGAPFEEGKCFPVFGPDLPWAQARRDYPFAVCVGYRLRDWFLTPPEELEGLIPTVVKNRNDPERIKGVLAELGFNHLYGEKRLRFDDGTLDGAIIVANDAFERLLPKH